jgi:hypothetical protein
MLSDKRSDDPLVDVPLIVQIEQQMLDASDSTEICGYFEVDSGNTLKIREPYYKGTITETGRHTCQRHGHPTKYLWHTHPINVKFYPSEEDILTVIKHKVYSYIFTPIGYWTLHCQEGGRTTKQTTKKTKKRGSKKRGSKKHGSKKQRAKSSKSSKSSSLQIIKSINKSLMHQALDYRTITEPEERLEVAKEHSSQPLIHRYESALMREFPGLYVQWTPL